MHCNVIVKWSWAISFLLVYWFIARDVGRLIFHLFSLKTICFFNFSNSLRLRGNFLFSLYAFNTSERDAPTAGVDTSPSILFWLFILSHLTLQLFSSFESLPTSLYFCSSNSAVLQLLPDFKSFPASLDFRRWLLLDRSFLAAVSILLTVLHFATVSQLLSNSVAFPLGLNSCCSIVFRLRRVGAWRVNCVDMHCR